MTEPDQDKELLSSGFTLYVRENTEETKKLSSKMDETNKRLDKLTLRVTVQDIILGCFLIVGIILLVWKWQYILNAINILLNVIGDRL